MADEVITPGAENPAWAGVKLAEGQIPLLPGAGKKANVFGNKDWGAPVAPIVVPGVPWEAAPGPLDQSCIKKACGSLLNSGCLADSSATVEGILKKWDRQQVTKKPAEKTWPDDEVQQEKAPVKKGNINYNQCIGSALRHYYITLLKSRIVLKDNHKLR